MMNRDCVPLVNVLGLIFQICDDYLNLSDKTYNKNKGLCEDLTEGKFSFPIIHSIRADPSNVQLINILKQKTKDEEVKLYALNYMEHTGSFAHTKKVVSQLREKALKLIDEMDGIYDGTEATDSPRDGRYVREILEKITEGTLKDKEREVWSLNLYLYLLVFRLPWVWIGFFFPFLDIFTFIVRIQLQILTLYD